MEQTSVWNALNQSFDFNEFRHPTAGGTTIQAFLCPSDSNKVARVGSSYNGVDFGDTNYYNNLGTLLSLNGGILDGPAWIMGSPNSNSSTNYGSPMTLAKITDGTSNTVIFSEMNMGNSSTLPGPGSMYIASTAVSPTAPANPNKGSTGANLQFINATYCLPSKNLSSFNTQGFSWLSQGNGEGGGYVHVNPPNSKSCWGNNQDSASPNGVNIIYVYGNMLTASSNHSGGVNMALIDGSVRFVKNSTNLASYAGIATVAGGEVISADSL